MEKITVKINEEVASILSKGRVDGCAYFLPEQKLSRDLYLDVNKMLELLGGKWNRSKKAHVFESAEKAQSVIEKIDDGEVLDAKKTYQFFETPSDVAKQMVELLDIKEGMRVLEPSAGHGAILKYLPKNIELHIIEIDKEKCSVLDNNGYSKVECVDFLTLNASVGDFDRIIMNPPFSRGQDAKHVLHAYELLRSGGRLVSVMSASITFNQQKKYQEIRNFIESNGKIITLPDKAFEESGTNVNTVLVVLDK